MNKKALIKHTALGYLVIVLGVLQLITDPSNPVHLSPTATTQLVLALGVLKLVFANMDGKKIDRAEDAAPTDPPQA